MNKRKDNKTRINGVRVRDIQHPEQSKQAKQARRVAKHNARIEAQKKLDAEAAKALETKEVLDQVATSAPVTEIKPKRVRKTAAPRLRQSRKGTA